MESGEYTITDFIGVFENAYSEEYCKELIDYFEFMNSKGLTYQRQDLEDMPRHRKSDNTVFMLEPRALQFNMDRPILNKFMDTFWSCYGEYAATFSPLLESEPHGVLGLRLQKTQPGEGYHHWHYEASDSYTCKRLCAWSLYLNTIDEGGETEFLYLNRRIKATLGTLLIWPSAFTHTHRGNPPLGQNKYLLTGWLEFLGPQQPT
jgi:hypothetical protein